MFNKIFFFKYRTRQIKTIETNKLLILIKMVAWLKHLIVLQLDKLSNFLLVMNEGRILLLKNNPGICF